MFLPRGDNCQLPGQQIRVAIRLAAWINSQRFIRPGDIVRSSKDYLQSFLEDEPEDLIHADENGEVQADSEAQRIVFDWNGRNKRLSHETWSSRQTRTQKSYYRSSVSFKTEENFIWKLT